MAHLPKFLQNPFKPKTGWLELLVTLYASPILVPHELSHYVAARVLGLNPIFTLWAVRHDHRGFWRTLVVILTPTMVGVLWIAFGVLLLVYWATTRLQTNVAWLTIIQGSGIFLTSGHDWVEAYKEIRGECE